MVTTKLSEIAANVQTGAWMTLVVYDNHKVTYDSALPPNLRHLVIHPSEGEGPILCPLRKLGAGMTVPGATWNGAYQIPDPEPEQITPFEAPVNERNTFDNAVKQLENACTQGIRKHFQTHDASDEVVKNYWKARALLRLFDVY